MTKTMAVTGRKVIRVGQRFTHRFEGDVREFERLPDAPDHPGKNWNHVFYRIRALPSATHRTGESEFSQSHLWFWSRGFTPEGIRCTDCGSADGVRIFPSRYACFGEDPICVQCKQAALLGDTESRK